MIGMISYMSPYSRNYYFGLSNNNAAVHMMPRSYSSASNPQTPVQPVTPAPPVYAVSSDEGSSGIPFLRQGVDPVEMAVRMRIQYVDQESAGMPGASSQSGEGQQVQGTGEAPAANNETECRTCAERKYQDGSDDPGVSFKTPTHISPQEAPAAVRGHEQEHVVREQAKAEREGREVVSQHVALHTNICPECGKVYISGGTTTTTTRGKEEPEQPSAAYPLNAGFFAIA